MIQVENLSFGFPDKELYEKISFTIEAGQHCALIGSNGTGKSTLIEMFLDQEKYLYEGKILREEPCRTGYVSQFTVREKQQEQTVFSYLSEKFIENQRETEKVCEEMANAEDLEPVYERYQELLDEFAAMDGDNYEGNIRKQLYVAGMKDLEELTLSQLSGGEYKLLQVMKEMLLKPQLLIMDEPDVFLDFENLNRLCRLINHYPGTLLAVTHNRYLLHHCFQKILHLENKDIQEFDGTYTEYRISILREKLKLKEQNLLEQQEIERTEKLVERMRTKASNNSSIASFGRTVHAKQTQLDRLRARQIKAPFIEVREPKIQFPKAEPDRDQVLLKVEDYQAAFEEILLEDVSFELHAGEKIALVGANGTGKTTLLKDILQKTDPRIWIDQEICMDSFSQFQNRLPEEEQTVYEMLESFGLGDRVEAGVYLKQYCLSEEMLDQKIGNLSGGEKNLLQLAKIALGKAELLILDEPSSHLDLFAQDALEKAMKEYQGAVLMVSHDFYLIADCADSVLLVEDQNIRKVRGRTFRKMVYEKYFDQKYLEVDQKKQDLEARISRAFLKNDLSTVEKLCDQMEALTKSLADK